MGLCQEGDFPVFFPQMAAPLGAAYTLAGRAADAVSLLAQAMEQTTATGRAGLQALCRLSLGEAQVLAGRLEEAHALAERALALACEHQERGDQAYALRLLGDIAARRDPLEREQVEAHYRDALAVAGEVGMRPLQAHCHLGLGKLYTKIGRRAELSAALEVYRAMEMTFWPPQAEAALEQVEAQIGCCVRLNLIYQMTPTVYDWNRLSPLTSHARSAFACAMSRRSNGSLW